MLARFEGAFCNKQTTTNLRKVVYVIDVLIQSDSRIGMLFSSQRHNSLIRRYHMDVYTLARNLTLKGCLQSSSAIRRGCLCTVSRLDSRGCDVDIVLQEMA